MAASPEHFKNDEFLLDLKNCSALNTAVSESNDYESVMNRLDKTSNPNSLHRISVSHSDRHLFAFATSAPYRKTDAGLQHPHTDDSWSATVSSFFRSWQSDPVSLPPSLPSSDSLVETIYVCFQGTQTAKHLRTDLLAFQTPPFQDGITGKVHYGFWKISKSIPVDFFVSYLFHFPNSRIVFTGHSLGAALALLVAVRLLKGFQESERVSCILFGLPPVGDQEFMRSIASVLPVQNLVVFVHVFDIVPRLVFALGHLLSSATTEKLKISQAAHSLLTCLTSPSSLSASKELFCYLLGKLSGIVQAQLNSYDVYGSYYFLRRLVGPGGAYTNHIPSMPICDTREIFQKLVVENPPRIEAISLQSHLLDSYLLFVRDKFPALPQIPRAKLPLTFESHFRLHKREWRVLQDKTTILECPQYATLRFSLEALDFNGISWGLSIITHIQFWKFPPIHPCLGSTDKQLIFSLQIPKQFSKADSLDLIIWTTFTGTSHALRIPMFYGDTQNLRSPKKLRDIEAFPRIIIQKTFMTALYHPTQFSRKLALDLLEELDQITSVTESHIIKQVDDLCKKREFFKVLFAGMSDKEMSDLEEKFAPLVKSFFANPDPDSQQLTVSGLIEQATPALEATHLSCSNSSAGPSSSSSIPEPTLSSSESPAQIPLNRCTLSEAIQRFEAKTLNSSEAIISAGHLIVRMNLVIAEPLLFRKSWYSRLLPLVGVIIGGALLTVGVFWAAGLAIGLFLGVLAEASFGAALLTGGIGTLGALLGAIAEGVFTDIRSTSNLYYLNLSRIATCLRVVHENSSALQIEDNIFDALQSRHGLSLPDDLMNLENSQLQATNMDRFIDFFKVRRFLIAVRTIRRMRRLVGEEYRIGVLGSMKTGKSTLLARLGFETNPSATIHTVDTKALSFSIAPNLIFYDFPGSDDIDPRTIASFQSWNRMIDFLIIVTEFDKSDNQYLQSLIQLLISTSRPVYILFNKADLAAVDTTKQALLTKEALQQLATSHLVRLVGDQVHFNLLTSEEPILLHYSLTCFDNQFFRPGYTRAHANSCDILNAPQVADRVLQYIAQTDEIQLEKEIRDQIIQIVTDADAQAEAKSGFLFGLPSSSWSLEDWLTTLEMSQYIEVFRNNGLTTSLRIKALTDDNLKNDLSITNLGDRLELLDAITKLT